MGTDVQRLQQDLVQIQRVCNFVTSVSGPVTCVSCTNIYNGAMRLVKY